MWRFWMWKRNDHAEKPIRRAGVGADFFPPRRAAIPLRPPVHMDIRNSANELHFSRKE